MLKVSLSQLLHASGEVSPASVLELSKKYQNPNPPPTKKSHVARTAMEFLLNQSSKKR